MSGVGGAGQVPVALVRLSMRGTRVLAAAAGQVAVVNSRACW
jgi:hypothetical protein